MLGLLFINHVGNVTILPGLRSPDLKAEACIHFFPISSPFFFYKACFFCALQKAGSEWVFFPAKKLYNLL
jgi:hypothetical protein